MMVIASSAFLAVLAVLGYAAAGKLRDLRTFTASVEGYRLLPQRLARAAAVLVAAAELAGAVLLAGPATRFFGAVLAAVLFALFIGAMASTLLRGMRVDCGCFPAGHADPVGPGSLVRTGLLLVLAVTAASTASQPFRPAEVPAAAALLVLVIIVAELARRLAGTDASGPPGHGPPPGTALDIGTPVEAVSEGADPVMFGFVSPLCPSCRSLLPVFAAMAARMRVVLVSSVQREEAQAYLDEQGIDLPLVTGPAVFDANDIPWPPYVVITTGRGIVLAQGGANRPEHIEAVLERAAAQARPAGQ
jgi:thiol-disulfide isomerase/thioredoxin